MIKKCTIIDIAKHVGVTPSTVSRALSDHPGISEKTRVSVMKAADELGYVRNLYATLMRKEKTRIVGLIVPEIRNEFFSTVAALLAEFCHKNDFQMAVCTTGECSDFEEKQTRALVEARISGVIISPTEKPSRMTETFLQSIPTIQLSRYAPGIGGVRFFLDESGGIGAATEHVLALGHRRIAYVGAHNRHFPGAERLRAFTDAHAGYGLVPDECLIRLGHADAEFGRQAVTGLLSGEHGAERPTAIILGSMEITAVTLQVIAEKGLRIPQDISLVGYGDPLWYSLLPTPLTTVHLPIAEMALKAVEALFAEMGGQGQTIPSYELPFHSGLVLRQSTRAVSGS